MTTLTAVVHGHAKVGKSWLLDTMPAPRLIIDAEGGSRFTPSSKIVWDPARENPPQYDGTWDSAIVYAFDYATLDRVYQWLASGQHQFVSVGHDHLTEIQKRVITHFNGTQALREADWGTLLRHMEDYLRRHRDLALVPNNPVQTVVFACATHVKDERVIPMLQGGFRDVLPYMVDLIGYMYTEQPEDAPLRRRLLINPVPPFEAGDRTDVLTQAYGPVIDQPNISQMLEVIKNHA